MALAGSRVILEAAILITNTAKTLEELGLDPDLIATSDTVNITVEAAARYTYGTVVPTAAIGHYLVAQVPRDIRAISALRYMKFIRVGGADVVGFVTLTKL